MTSPRPDSTDCTVKRVFDRRTVSAETAHLRPGFTRMLQSAEPVELGTM